METDIIAANQTAAAIAKLRRGEADDNLRDEVQAATLSTMQKMLEELSSLKSRMWDKSDLKALIDEQQSRHCDHCPTKKWVENQMMQMKAANDRSQQKGNWFVELVKSESLRYFLLIALLVFALMYIKGGVECVEAAKDGLTHTMTGGLKK